MWDLMMMKFIHHMIWSNVLCKLNIKLLHYISMNLVHYFNITALLHDDSSDPLSDLFFSLLFFSLFLHFLVIFAVWLNIYIHWIKVSADENVPTTTLNYFRPRLRLYSKQHTHVGRCGLQKLLQYQSLRGALGSRVIHHHIREKIINFWLRLISWTVFHPGPDYSFLAPEFFFSLVPPSGRTDGRPGVRRSK